MYCFTVATLFSFVRLVSGFPSALWCVQIVGVVLKTLGLR